MKMDKKSALLIIDVQNDFCPGGALAVPKGDEVVPVLNSAAARFSTVVATKDWHPRGHISFASVHEGATIGEVRKIGGLDQVMWPDHCIPGTPGAAFHPDLAVDHINLIVHKGLDKKLDSYSAFFENDGTTPTGLEGYLRGLGIGQVFIGGLATDYCVYFSAKDALKCEFSVFLLEDAVRGVDVPEGNLGKTVDDMKRSGVVFISSQEL
jgi:nicotinamidase/pyrazinamidase